MRVRLTFKTPDVLDQLEDQVEDDELGYVKNICREYIEYSEYVTIAFDIVPMAPIKVEVLRAK